MKNSAIQMAKYSIAKGTNETLKNGDVKIKNQNIAKMKMKDATLKMANLRFIYSKKEDMNETLKDTDREKKYSNIAKMKK